MTMLYRMPDWDRIKAHYEAAPTAIHQVRDEWLLDPYAWDHQGGVELTPIERALWHDIRAEDLVLYPQYPVGRFFVDFGNPAAKVALECDGAAFHQDKDRDASRQREIEALGWTVHRFTSHDCLADTRETEDEYGRIHVQLSEGRLRVRAIGLQHQIARRMRSQRSIQAAVEALLGGVGPHA